MEKRFIICLMLVFAFFVSSVAVCHAEDWELIAQQGLLKNPNQTVISVSNQEVLYTQLQFGVKDGFIKIFKIIAHTADGTEIPVRVDQFLNLGERTAPIKLSNTGVALTSVDLFYYTKRRGTTVELYGMGTPVPAGSGQ